MSKEDDYKFILAKEIMCRRDFTGAIVYGGQSLGKTSYTMQVAYDIYKDWDKVFQNMFFDLEELVTYLKQLMREKKRADFIIWDDAGVHGNKLLYFNDPMVAQLLQNLFDVIRIACRGIALSTPVPSNLLKSLRDYEFFKIKIVRANQFNRREAKAYSPNLLPSSKVFIHKDFKDVFNTNLPEDVYKRYTPIRASYLIAALDNLEKIITEKKLEQCIGDE